MKVIGIVLWGLFLTTGLAAQASTTARVPSIFTGNSPAPAYQNYKKFKNKKDTRDSRGYSEYYYDQAKLDRIHASTGVRSVHTIRNVF